MEKKKEASKIEISLRKRAFGCTLAPYAAYDALERGRGRYTCFSFFFYSCAFVFIVCAFIVKYIVINKFKR